MISITIPVISGRHLENVLKSIYLQSYKDFEIVIVNGTRDKEFSKIFSEFPIKEVNYNGSSLGARWVGALNSHGNYILQLDETRIISDIKCLEKLAASDVDAVYLREFENVNTIISRAANFDREILFNVNDILNGTPSIIPRFYRTEILKNSFEKLRNELKDKFSLITAPEDLLIFIEAKNMITTFKIFNEPMIMHLGDDTLKQVIRKYYRYGKNFSLLEGTRYQNIGHLSNQGRIRTRIKNARNYSELVIVILLLAVRGISVELGELKASIGGKVDGR